MPTDPILAFTIQQSVNTCVFSDTPFIIELLKAEMDQHAAEEFFCFHAAEWNIAMPITQRTNIVRMYVARESAD
jgi:hypothetical protein